MNGNSLLQILAKYHDWTDESELQAVSEFELDKIKSEVGNFNTVRGEMDLSLMEIWISLLFYNNADKKVVQLCTRMLSHNNGAKSASFWSSYCASVLNCKYTIFYLWLAYKYLDFTVSVEDRLSGGVYQLCLRKARRRVEVVLSLLIIGVFTPSLFFDVQVHFAVTYIVPWLLLVLYWIYRTESAVLYSNVCFNLYSLTLRFVDFCTKLIRNAGFRDALHNPPPKNTS